VESALTIFAKFRFPRLKEGDKRLPVSRSAVLSHASDGVQVDDEPIGSNTCQEINTKGDNLNIQKRVRRTDGFNSALVVLTKPTCLWSLVAKDWGNVKDFDQWRLM